MKLRDLSLSIKLTIAYSLLILFVSSILTYGLYLEATASHQAAFQERLRDIINFSLPLVDGDYHGLILSAEDEDTPYYEVIFNRLHSIHETSPVISRIYTIRQDENGRFSYIVDTSSSQNEHDSVDTQAALDQHIHVGEPYDRFSPLLNSEITDLQIEESNYTDSDGNVLLRGYAPIIDQFDRINGILVIELDTSPSRARQRHAVQMAIITFAATIPPALFFGWRLAKQLTSPVIDLLEGAQRIAQGDLSRPVPVHNHDELGQSAIAFNTMTDRLREMLQNLEHRVSYRTKQVETALDVSRQLASVLDTDTLTQNVVNIVKESFDFYYVQIYLLDDAQENLYVAAGYGKRGQAMIRQHHIPFNAKKSLVAQAAQTKLPVIVSNTHTSEEWLPNVLLPDTASEIAVPIILDGKALGVLDVQEDEIGSLGDEQASLMQILAAQIAIAMQRAQLFAHVETALTEVEKSNQELAEINKELDQFAYIISHDLKAPLRAINNLSQWIEEDMGDDLPEDVQTNLILMRQRVGRMQKLINGVLEYSRAGRTDTPDTSVNVHTLLTDVIDILSPPPEFTISIGQDMPTLFTEETKLEQVFSNLISNAIKYHDRTDGRIEITVQPHNEFYQFTVKDDGPGISERHHKRIFDIFQTILSRNTDESTGIGLAVVKKIVEEQKGDIWVESVNGEGSSFHFTWPRNLKGGEYNA